MAVVRLTSNHPRAAAGSGGVVDTLVQGALVELFETYGVPLDPMPRASLRDAVTFHDVTASIGFVREVREPANRAGRLTISMPSGVFELANDDEIRAARRDDWMRELVNQLMGRIKNRLLQFGATLQIGLPDNISPDSQEKPAASSTLLVYTGSTPQGEILITLDGMPDESELSYVGREAVALEGELLLF